MRQLPVLLVSLGAVAFFARIPAKAAETAADKGVELAQRELQRVEDLVQAGALPRVRIQQAENNLADAQDEAVLERTLYGELPANGASGDAPGQMLAAAERRVDRAQARLEQARKVVDAGVAARSYLSSFQEELTLRETSLDLARLRAQLMAQEAAADRYEESVAHESATPQIDNSDLAFQGMQHYEGHGTFDEARDLQPLELAFESRFARPLPISAEGETEVHRALGFDHRGRVDVAVNPSDPEGLWLREYLRARKIPYYAFTHAIPGKATAAHIHIGPGSTRLSSGLTVRAHSAD
jgi:hypothetical protein